MISEAVRGDRNPAVVSWLDAQVVETLYLTAINLAELRLGIAILPTGKRKESLQADIDALVIEFFGLRILPFEKEAAIAYGNLVSAARLAGSSVSVSDGQIAAIASVHKFAVATRDTSPFVALGVAVINPWSKG